MLYHHLVVRLSPVAPREPRRVAGRPLIVGSRAAARPRKTRVRGTRCAFRPAGRRDTRLAPDWHRSDDPEPVVGRSPTWPFCFTSRISDVRVLIIDQDPGVRHTLERLLAPRRHNILTAPSTIDARVLLLDIPMYPDVALLDEVTTTRSGGDYGSELRMQFPRARLIRMVSGIGGGHPHNVAAYAVVLQKPFTLAELIEAMGAGA